MHHRRDHRGEVQARDDHSHVADAATDQGDAAAAGAHGDGAIAEPEEGDRDDAAVAPGAADGAVEPGAGPAGSAAGTATDAARQTIKRIMEQPNIDQVLRFLKDNRARSFVLDIETDSTIMQDENAEKQRRAELSACCRRCCRRSRRWWRPSRRPRTSAAN